ncbi:MAG: rod shape-determining protein RodA [Bacteroidales bacterium]|nr:rod shape-determining protein RodA [Bacteroidales bacterium]
MTSFQKEIRRTIDWKLVISWVVLVLIGWINIYASVHFATSPDLVTRPEKQLIWIAGAVIIAVLVLFVFKPKFWEMVSLPAYLTILALLILVIFIGADIKGSHSWITFGPVSFQPAELSKITTSLMLAAMLGKPNGRIKGFGDIVRMLVIIGLPALAILAEKETGSMLVYAGFLLVLFREGMSGWILAFLGMVILLFILTLISPRWVPFVVMGILVLTYYLLARTRGARYSKTLRKKLIIYCLIVLATGAVLILSTDPGFDSVLQPHQRLRIEVLLGLREDPTGVGYNVNQSMIAIGSGGMFGKGFLKGTQTAFGFVPEQSTDFIFCTVGEEWGFFGCFVVISLYVFLISRILLDAEKCREPFNRIYGYCVAAVFFMHLFINVGMTIGLMPVIGIPLPFMSYGGSSMWAFTAMLFIFLALYRQENKRSGY